MQSKLRRISKVILIIPFLFVFLGISLLVHKYYKQDNIRQKEEIKVEEILNVEVEKSTVPVEKEIIEEKKEQIQQIKYDYIGVLEINSISFKRGFVDINSKYNKVNYNIQIIKGSEMPDVKNGNFIIAGHNGNSYVSFFKNLYKMNYNDLINVYYKGYKYVYKYENYYEVNKNGFVEIVRDNNKNTITLITCKKNSKDKQLVFIGYLIDKVEY